MIFNATGKYGQDTTLIRAAFDDRGWVPVGGPGHVVDVERQKRWLGGVGDVHQNPPPPRGPCALLVAAEMMRGVEGKPGGDARGVRDMLKTFRQERPDILLLVYDPSLRFAPEIPGQRDRMMAELDRRLKDELELEIWSLTGIWCPDWYWMGLPAKTACEKCNTPGRGTGIDATRADVERSRASLPAYLDGQEEIAAIVEKRTGCLVAPTIHERYHPGHGMRLDIFMDIPEWEFYLAGVRARRRHSVWWTGPRVVGHRPDGVEIYEWAKPEVMKPFIEAAVKSAAS